MRWCRTLLLAAAALALSVSAAGAAVFNISRTVGTASVTGTLTTDGTLGVLGTANILDWHLVLQDGPATATLTTTTSGRLIQGSALSATGTELVFDFGAPSGIALFQAPAVGSGGDFWCLEVSGCTGGVTAESVLPGFDWGSMATAAHAGPVVIGTIATAVPAPAAVLVLSSGLLGLGLLRLRRG